MASWLSIPFEEAISDASGGNAKTPTGEFQESGRYPIVDQGKELVSGFTDDGSRLCNAPLPVIIFGDHTRCFKFVDFPFCMGADGIKVLRPRVPAHEKFLYHYFRSLNLPEAGYDRHFKYLKRTSVLLPPLEEQRRIAGILDQADALRAKRRAALAQLDTLTRSFFQSRFGDLDRRERLGNLVEEFRYGTSLKSGPTGYPALRIPNVIGGGLDLSDLKLVPVEDSEFRRLRLQAGDLLFVRTNGNPDFVGRCATFEPTLVEKTGLDPSRFIYASYLIRARIKSRLLPRVLQEFLSTSDGRRELRGRTKTSAGQYNINTDSLASLPIPVPPLSMQREFVELVEVVERAKASHRSSLTHLNALFASLQRRAFRGDL